ncbi:MAG TPA: hypothetical protein VL463_14475 [Kofleriaceae bacterium]|jgi:hypothetical protein|nr:hypothetical protein [Kofleriaceae bacterium]
MRIAVTAFLVVAACGKSAPAPSCHDRVAAMAAHLAAPRSLEELKAGNPTSEEIVKKILPVLDTCRTGAAVFASVASLEGGTDKSAYLRDKVPPAIEACSCAADPDTLGPLLEQLFDTWHR